MPNFDTGHYFLTTLAPIKRGLVEGPRGGSISHRQDLRMLFSLMPTALQSPATEQIGINSPFAHNRRTHLCRFVVIDDTIYNGRNASNAIINGIVNRDPIVPRDVDELKTAYLMFAADFDAVMENGDPLPATLSQDQHDEVRDAGDMQGFKCLGGARRRLLLHSLVDGVEHDRNGKCRSNVASAPFRTRRQGVRTPVYCGLDRRVANLNCRHPPGRQILD